MADWEHKERIWSFIKQDDASGQEVSTAYWKDTDPEYGHGFHEKNSEWLKFTDWLDMQCKDGWEVIKIARNFNPVGKNGYGEPIKTMSTWCVFRRKVD